MRPRDGNGLALWSAATIFVSAFLLFQVQPVISKTILPWFGGSPSVWTTCMLFFQVLLLAGYAYAHLLVRQVAPSRQGLIHAGLLLVAMLLLPITPSDWWKPADGAMPALRILVLLAAKVGVPYFLLSSTGPLIQGWFHLAYPGRSPYRLYALSNVGSLLALLSYPFVVEVLLPVRTQGNLWSLGFVLFAVLAGGWGLVMWKRGAEWQSNLAAEARLVDLPEPSAASAAERGEVPAEPTTGMKLSWVLLAALASTALLAFTNYLSQDIAVVPLLWIAPLSIYLVSFIICFDRESWYNRKLFGALGVVGILMLAFLRRASDVDAFLKARLKIDDGIVQPFNDLMRKWHSDFRLDEFGEHVIVSSVVYLIVLFVICMLCHGELVRTKPKPRYLTGFYLMVSLGGALGGLFVAILSPFLFRLPFEMPMSILCGFVVAWLALFNDGREKWLKDRPVVQWSMAFALVGSVMLTAMGVVDKHEENVVAMARNFYGYLAVKQTCLDDDPANCTRTLFHGRIIHGLQYTDPLRSNEATSYYVNASGVGMAVEQYPREGNRGMRVAVIGLGTGTMAAHAQKNDVYNFYEIDPKVVRLSDAWFTYRADCAGKTNVILGDARIQMEREPDQNYDVIVIDAFSGDAIPAHLLTEEAFAIYLRHLRKDKAGEPIGIIAVHISNRYLDLKPVVAAAARRYELPAELISFEDELTDDSFGSEWILLTRNERFWNQPLVAISKEPLDVPEDRELLWTDQRSNLFEILK